MDQSDLIISLIIALIIVYVVYEMFLNQDDGVYISNSALKKMDEQREKAKSSMPEPIVQGDGLGLDGSFRDTMSVVSNHDFGALLQKKNLPYLAPKVDLGDLESNIEGASESIRRAEAQAKRIEEKTPTSKKFYGLEYTGY